MMNVLAIFPPSLTRFAVQKNFVQVVRAVEWALGIPVPGYSPMPDSGSRNATSCFSTAAESSLFSDEVRQVLQDSIPVFTQVARQLTLVPDFNHASQRRQPLVTTCVDNSRSRNGSLVILTSCAAHT